MGREDVPAPLPLNANTRSNLWCKRTACRNTGSYRYPTAATKLPVSLPLNTKTYLHTATSPHVARCPSLLAQRPFAQRLLSPPPSSLFLRSLPLPSPTNIKHFTLQHFRTYRRLNGRCDERACHRVPHCGARPQAVGAASGWSCWGGGCSCGSGCGWWRRRIQLAQGSAAGSGARKRTKTPDN
jgi:hypothetical protein